MTSVVPLWESKVKMLPIVRTRFLEGGSAVDDYLGDQLTGPSPGL